MRRMPTRGALPSMWPWSLDDRGNTLAPALLPGDRGQISRIWNRPCKAPVMTVLPTLAMQGRSGWDEFDLFASQEGPECAAPTCGRWRP